MAISSEERNHGAALLLLFEVISKELSSCTYTFERGMSRSAYILRVSNKENGKTVQIGLFIKVSSKRRSPWRYTFVKDHQQEFEFLKLKNSEVFLILIAGDDGYGCLNFEQVKSVLDSHYEDAEWIALSRKLNEAYRVSGSNGKMEKTLPGNVFPNIVVNTIQQLIN